MVADPVIPPWMRTTAAPSACHEDRQTGREPVDTVESRVEQKYFILVNFSFLGDWQQETTSTAICSYVKIRMRPSFSVHMKLGM